MLDAITLQGTRVRLEPLSLEHVPQLVRAASIDRRDYALTDVPADQAAMRRYVEVALAGRSAGTMLPFATIDRSTGRVVGSTRFGYIEFWNWSPGNRHQRGERLPDVVEIGWTWLAADSTRTGINREAKLLMLTHAFEHWRVHRVSMKTDARNRVSRTAIEGLGAHLDGVLRAAKIAHDGEIRDTAAYSILDSEWPATKTNLISGLKR